MLPFLLPSRTLFVIRCSNTVMNRATVCRRHIQIMKNSVTITVHEQFRDYYSRVQFSLPPSDGQNAIDNTYTNLTNTIAPFSLLCDPSPRFQKWAICTLTVSLSHTYALVRHILRNAPLIGVSAYPPCMYMLPRNNLPHVLQFDRIPSPNDV